MEKLPSSGKYSLKNIAIPPKRSEEFNKKILSQTEHLIRRMRWRAINYFQHLEDQKSSSDNENENSNCNSEPEFEPNFESYGFRSARKPKRVPELDKFEAALWKLVKNVTNEYT